jgi:hypothetical protein
MLAILCLPYRLTARLARPRLFRRFAGRCALSAAELARNVRRNAYNTPAAPLAGTKS